MLTGVVIPTFNRKNILENVLTKLSLQQIVGVQLQVIVVVDGSTDGTLEMLKEKFPSVVVIAGNGSWWFTKSLNEGIKRAVSIGCNAIITINDDVDFGPDYISKMINGWKNAGENSVLGSLSVTWYKPNLITYSGVKDFNKLTLKKTSLLPYHQVYNSKIHQGLVPTKTLVTRGMIASATIFTALNFLDENLPQYGSDEEFGLRADKAGYKLFMNFDALLFENEQLTGMGSPRFEKSFIKFTKSFFNEYSRISIKKTVILVWKHGYKLLLPLILIYDILGNYKSFFKNRKKNFASAQ